jgi:hypothetical protein
MAVSNALGVWITSYPTTPAKILAALGKTGSNSKPPFEKGGMGGLSRGQEGGAI